MMTVRDALNSAFDEEMYADLKVFLMGEEVGQYQCAYKITEDIWISMALRGFSIPQSQRCFRAFQRAKHVHEALKRQFETHF
ncbi:hypothetical protein ABKV19_022574 [Rosa sericea]